MQRKVPFPFQPLEPQSPLPTSKMIAAIFKHFQGRLRIGAYVRVHL